MFSLICAVDRISKRALWELKQLKASLVAKIKGASQSSTCFCPIFLVRTVTAFKKVHRFLALAKLETGLKVVGPEGDWSSVEENPKGWGPLGEGNDPSLYSK